MKNNTRKSFSILLVVQNTAKIKYNRIRRWWCTKQNKKKITKMEVKELRTKSRE